MQYSPILESTVQRAIHPAEQDGSYRAVTGVSAISEQVEANKTSNSSQTQFNLSIPNTSVLLDSCIYVRYKFTVRIAKGADTDCLRKAVALRSFPVNNSISSCDVRINGLSSTDESFNFKTIRERMIDLEFKRNFLTSTPYSSETRLTIGQQQLLTNHPIFQNVDGKQEYLDPPHFFAFQTGGADTDGGPGPLDVEFTVIEPLMHPLLEMKPGIRSFYNLTSFNLTLNWTPNRLDTVCYLNTDATGNTTLNHTITTQVEPSVDLLIKYITPLDILPVNYNYEYSRFNRLTTPLSNIANGASKVFNTTITSSTVPDYLIIQVNRVRATDTTYRKTLDMSNASIASININVNNMEGRFSSADSHHLFEMSARNGYIVGWDQWNSWGKQVLVIKVGQDIQRILPGSKSQFSAVVNVNATNILAAAADFELTVIQVTPNMYQFNGTTVTSLEGFDYNQVQQSVNSGEVPQLDNYNDQPQSKDGQGLSFKKFWRGVKKTVGTLSPALSMAAGAYGGPAAMMATDAVSNLVTGHHGGGLGHHGGMVYMGGQGRLGSGQLGSGHLGGDLYGSNLGSGQLGSGNLGSGLKKKRGGSRMYQ